MKREIKVGLTLFAAIAGLYLLVIWAKNLHFFAAPGKHYTLHFDRINGLKEGDPVNVLGFPSGTVRAITLEKGQPTAKIYLNQEIILFADAHAEIQVREVLSGKMIELYPGTSSEILAKNTIIPGHLALDFSTAFTRFGEVFENLDPASLDSLVADIRIITREMASLSRQLGDSSFVGVLFELSMAAKNMNGLMQGVQNRNLLGKADSAIIHFSRLATDGGEMLSELKKMGGDIRSETLPKADSLLNKFLSGMDQAETTLTQLQTLLSQLQNPDLLAGKLLTDPQMVQKLDYTLDNLNKTMEHVRTKRLLVGLKPKKEK